MAKKRKKASKKKSKTPKSAKRPTAGQPTKYKPEHNKQVVVLAEKGFTDEEIAKVFDVTEQTINNWKKRFPQFFESLKKGKAIADQKVVHSLYERAVGYSYPDIHITNYQGKITKTNIIKHYAPDPTSMIFWLKNRDPENWKDRHDQVISGDLAVTLTIK